MTVDQADRDRARLELRKNVVVEAGAGTGKTTLLTDRMLFALVAGGQGGAPIELSRMVALTFTEKAAGEIRQRLSTRLLDLLSMDAPPADPRLRAESARWLKDAREALGLRKEAVLAAARRAVQDMDRAQIGTIHSFAAQLLRLYPVEAGVDPSFEVDPGEGLRSLFASQWPLWLSAELGEGAPRRKLWLEVLALAALDDLEELARSLCLEETRQGSLGAGPAMKERFRRLAARFGRLKDVDTGRAKAFRENLLRAVGHLEAVSRSLDHPEPLPEERALPGFDKRAAPKAWAEEPGADIYREGIELAADTSPVSESLIRKAVELVRPFADEFRETYNRKGLIGYHGLLAKALSVVRGARGVRQALKRQFDALLIDEFQDTDPLQGELLLFLAEEDGSFAGRWRDVRLAPGKLFIVGDPKQSIYRFRGADMRAYGAFTKLLLDQGAEKCELRASFRSHASIVAPVNAVFSRLMTETEALQPRYLPIESLPEKTSRLPGVELALVRAGDVREEEAAWIARWIAAHCSLGGKFRLKEVAILLRKTTALGIYLQALKDAGIPYVVESDRYFYGTQEAVDFLNLLRLLDEPLDAVAFAGLLRSPLVGLADEEIYALARDGALSLSKPPRPGVIRAQAGRRLEAFRRMVLRIRERAGREPLGDFVHGVLTDTFIVQLCAAAYHREQTAANLMKFGRLAAEAGDSRGATLKEFIGQVSRSLGDSDDEGESPLADEQLDAVRILTVHKAKGLEYPVVILPDLGGEPSAERKRPAFRVDWATGTTGLYLERAKAGDAAAALIKLEQRERDRHEWVRLLYVAMTRAKEHLLLVGGADHGKEGSFSGLLRRAGAWPAKGERPEAVELGESRLPVSYIGAGAQDEPVRFAAEPESVPALDAEGIAKAWVERSLDRERTEAAPLFSSPTALLKEREKRSFQDGERGLAVEAASLVGRACHRVLELWNFKDAAAVAGLLDSACAALSEETPAADWEEIARRAREALEAFAGSRAAEELAGSVILGREVPFVYAREGRIMRGSIDVLYRHGGRLWVGDYKTAAPPKGGEARLAAGYAAQGGAYVEAVMRATGEIPGFKVIFLPTGESVEVEAHWGAGGAEIDKDRLRC